MCGICGEIRFDGSGGRLSAAVSRMMGSMSSRGPDAEGAYAP